MHKVLGSIPSATRKQKAFLTHSKGKVMGKEENVIQKQKGRREGRKERVKNKTWINKT
jgi:hypothetical protein